MNRLHEIIAAEICSRGPISFARFMELALYCPVYGYYEKETDTVGRRGDFYTSPTVGRVFGELLAFQFADWLQQQEQGMVHLVEAGAHRGYLGRDILAWLRQWRPALFARLEYWLIEPSPRRREWQRATLAEFGSKVRWTERWSGLTQQDKPLCGIVFSNELLDAFPVHRLGWDARAHRWFEWGVSLEGERFVWKQLDSSDLEAARLPALPEPLLETLPDGFVIEVCPAAEVWWQEAATALRSGKLVTFDYGFEAEEFLRPERQTGTLRAYFRHRPAPDLLANPGEQDLTAHVDFTSLKLAGQAMGMRTEEILSQAQFLTRIAARDWRDEGLLATWTSAQTRQFQTLTHPEHLGRAFRVLVQSRQRPRVD